MSKLDQDIEALGNTDEEIAEYLRANGIKGTIHHAYECPIANYLRAKGWQQIEVSNAGISAADASEQDYTIIPPPWPVVSFIDGFDSGKEYQDLKKT